MIKLKNKKSSLKKITWFFIVLFCFTLLYLPRWEVKAADNIITYEDQIKILEIEPGNQFLLGDSSKIGDLPVSVSNGKNVAITHLTMAQFISMVDEIDGKYDAVVIGRKNYNLKATYSKGTAYRDYTNPFSQQMNYLPLSTWSLYSHWQKNYTNNIDGVKFAEYYSENDITQKRADEILAMTKKNQLVCMDSKINNDDIKYTKLYSLYQQSQGINPVTTLQEDITVDKIVKKYNAMNSELKRPKVSKVTKPLDDYNSTEPTRKMKFTVNINDGKSERLKLKLYLDINADGLFKDKELVETYDFQTNSDGATDFTFTHDLDKNFIGYLDWKVEVIRENGIKTNLVENSKYKSLIGPKKLNVLQIIPDDSNLIDLSRNDLVNDSNVKDDYNIVIKSKRVSDVNSESKNGTFKLNGNYDMVIIGFADSYGFKKLESPAIDEIEAFIKTGQSVMFTHDTITPALANDLRPETGQTSTGPKDLTQRLRDYVGQARYIDPYRLKIGQNSTDIYKEEEVSRDGNGNITNVSLKDKTIPHDYFFGIGNLNNLNTNGVQVNTNSDYYKANDISHNSQIPYSLGTTLQGHVSNYAWDWNNSWNYINQVKKVNSAQINKYPFELGDTINVANTHTQWYQLNLEDPDVVPWFNLSATDIDTGDARNYYYTYSKGNITYSGTGHSGGYQTNEQQLFINTMIKAERGANHAPTINCSIPLENTDTTPQVNEVPAGKDYYFSIDADDYEKDIAKMHVTINDQELNNNNNIVSTVNLSDIVNRRLFRIQTSDSNRTSIKFKVPLTQLQETTGNIKVVVEAEDTQGAKSSKNYVLKPVKSTCSIDADFISALPNPAYSNQNIDVKYKITPNDYYYNNALNSQGPIDEAVFLVDISKTMSNTYYNRFSEIQNGITSKVLGDTALNNIKLAVVGYNDFVYIGNRDNINDPKSCIMEKTDESLTGIQKPLYNMYDANEKDGYRQFYQSGYVYNKISDNEQRQFGTALKVADSVLTKYGEVNSKKAIVIISSGGLTISDPEIENIRSKGYKIITLDISNSNSTNIESTYRSLGGNISATTGTTVDYYKGTFNDNSNYNSVNYDMGKVADSLKTGIQRTGIVSNAKINFNLGTNFQMVDSTYKYQMATSTDVGPIINNTSNKYSIDLLNRINYVATTEKDSEGRTKYIATPFEITFQIKPLVQSAGNLGFSGFTFNDEDFNNKELYKYGVNLYEQYNNVDNKFVYSDVFGLKTQGIFTPVIKVYSNINLEHGIYNGMDNINGKPIIDETDQSFAKGATVTFGAYISGNANNTPIRINFDKSLTSKNIDLSTIKVFKVENGKLYELSNDGNLVNNIYTYTPSGTSGTGNKLLILYTEVLPQNKGTYTNTLNVDGVPERNARITVTDQMLPDLF